jgi:hypothetical protein
LSKNAADSVAEDSALIEDEESFRSGAEIQDFGLGLGNEGSQQRHHHNNDSTTTTQSHRETNLRDSLPPASILNDNDVVLPATPRERRKQGNGVTGLSDQVTRLSFFHVTLTTPRVSLTPFPNRPLPITLAIYPMKVLYPRKKTLIQAP